MIFEITIECGRRVAQAFNLPYGMSLAEYITLIFLGGTAVMFAIYHFVLLKPARSAVGVLPPSNPDQKYLPPQMNATQRALAHVRKWR